MAFLCRQTEAAEIDEELFSKYGFKVEQLMELAGLACAKAIHAQYSKVTKCPPHALPVHIIPRKLQGFDPVVVFPKPSKTDLMNALVTQCSGMGIEVLPSLPELDDFSLIVDAFFGFSFKPPVREPFGEIIETVTKSGIFVFSIDIPSGWHVENGAPSEGPYIRPHGIISLTAPKMCVRDWTGPHFIGGRFVPKQLAEEHGLLLPQYPGADQIVKLE
ncbi:unnamed protein product [Nippostrongylus brasiliensis]|uniref:NAD(P)H-hydrate epimerase n=1 Tax=Nippostrongylus brasiliensis TaxID=27835 RepID=A0A0N4Y0F4_NIPBR|nr:unnamed protein product [Nippostrongylus brasiliensis]